VSQPQPTTSDAQETTNEQSEANLTADETADLTNIMVSECESISETSECQSKATADTESKLTESETTEVVSEGTKNQLLSNLNNYEKLSSHSPATQIDLLSLDSADEVSNVAVRNVNNKRSISPTPPTDPSQKMPVNKKPRESLVNI
jgi:hypothetical protein